MIVRLCAAGLRSMANSDRLIEVTTPERQREQFMTIVFALAREVLNRYFTVRAQGMRVRGNGGVAACGMKVAVSLPTGTAGVPTEWGIMNTLDYEVSPQEAFLRRRAELEAIPARDVMRLNLDPFGVVSVVLRADPRIRGLLAQYERSLQDFDFALVGGLSDYALAFYHTHTLFMATARPVRCPPELMQQAKPARARLLNFLNACAQRGLVDAGRWQRLRGTKGYLNVAADLGLLSSIALATPDVQKFEDLLPPGDLKRAELLARELLAVSGKRDVRQEALSAARDIRARAFTKVMLSYAEARRGVAYVRAPYGDAEDFAPILSTKRLPTRPRKHPTPKLAISEPHSGADGALDLAGAEPGTNEEKHCPSSLELQPAEVND